VVDAKEARVLCTQIIECSCVVLWFARPVKLYLESRHETLFVKIIPF